jgi:hypothetical protein
MFVFSEYAVQFYYMSKLANNVQTGQVGWSVHMEIPPYTHVKISHLVANLPTSRQQVAFALLVTSCLVVNKYGKTVNNL